MDKQGQLYICAYFYSNVSPYYLQFVCINDFSLSQNNLAPSNNTTEPSHSFNDRGYNALSVCWVFQSDLL